MVTQKQGQTSLRVLVLALNLLNTRIGYSREHLGRLVPGYEGLAEATFRRTFERDLAALREAGFIVEVRGGDEPRYLLAPGQSGIEPRQFTRAEVDLLLRAAGTWRDLSPADLGRLHVKLLALQEDDDSTAPTISQFQQLEGLEHLGDIVEAIDRRQPISFVYAGRRRTEERDVAPWSLSTRGTAVYLRGFDLNRWDERLFRLGRIQSGVRLIAEPDFYELPGEGADNDRWEFFVRPTLRVRQGAAPLVRLRCEPVQSTDPAQGELAPAGEGWDVCTGRTGDWASWERLVLAHAHDVEPLRPSHFRAEVLRILRASADLLSEKTGGRGGE